LQQFSQKRAWQELAWAAQQSWPWQAASLEAEAGQEVPVCSVVEAKAEVHLPSKELEQLEGPASLAAALS